MRWHPFAYTLPPVLIGTAAIVILQSQTVAVALESVEVGKIAKGITVLIRGNGKLLGSGVLIKKEGNTYTVLTAKHVVPGRAQYELETPDGKRYALDGNTIKPLSSTVDLAVVGFSSGTTYSLATIGDSNQVQEGSAAYVAGFPQLSVAITEPVYTFTEGKITANASRPLADGYALVYSNNTLPGMSGGPVLDANGKLIAIHGRAEGTTEVRQTETVRLKTGFNLGIPINTFVGLAPQVNIALAGVAPVVPRVVPPQLTAADYFLQGGEKYQKNDFKGAIADYNEAIRLDPKYVRAYNNRGIVRSEMGDKSGAISDYSEAIRFGPKDAAAYTNRAISRSEMGDKTGAISDFNEAIRFGSKDAAAYNNRGIARSKMGDKTGAISDYNEAIRLDPKYVNTYNSRAIDRFKMGDKTGAISDYNEAIRLDPKYVNAYYNRAIAHFKMGDKTGAISDYSEAIRLDPKYVNAYNNRGLIRSNMGDKLGAISDYNEAIRLDSKHINAYTNRGNTRSKMDDKPGAISDYTEVIRLDPKYAAAYNNRGVVRYALGDKVGAKTDLQKAAALFQSSGNEAAYQQVLRKLQELGLL